MLELTKINVFKKGFLEGMQDKSVLEVHKDFPERPTTNVLHFAPNIGGWQKIFYK